MRGEGPKSPHGESSSRAAKRGQRGREPPANCLVCAIRGRVNNRCRLERDGASAAAKPGAIQTVALRWKGGGIARLPERPHRSRRSGAPERAETSGQGARPHATTKLIGRKPQPVKKGSRLVVGQDQRVRSYRPHITTRAKGHGHYIFLRVGLSGRERRAIAASIRHRDPRVSVYRFGRPGEQRAPPGRSA